MVEMLCHWPMLTDIWSLLWNHGITGIVEEYLMLYLQQMRFWRWFQRSIWGSRSRRLEGNAPYGSGCSSQNAMLFDTGGLQHYQPAELVKDHLFRSSKCWWAWGLWPNFCCFDSIFHHGSLGPATSFLLSEEETVPQHIYMNLLQKFGFRECMVTEMHNQHWAPISSAHVNSSLRVFVQCR